MEDKILHRVECMLLGDEIICTKTQDNSGPEKLEIYSDVASKTKLYLQFSEYQDGQLVADCLIYEEYFSEVQKFKDLVIDTKEKISPYLEVFKLSLNLPNIRLGEISVTYPKINEIEIEGIIPAGELNFEIKVLCGTIDVTQHKIKKYLQKFPIYRSSNLLEYIERYNTIRNIQDPILRLINFHSLMEYIEYQTGSKISSLRQNSDFKWAKATRNLVSHGKLEGKDTVDALNQKLELEKTVFFFNRAEHLNLVNKALSLYNQELYAYLSNLLL